jgi:hypothetical protein
VSARLARGALVSMGRAEVLFATGMSDKNTAQLLYTHANSALTICSANNSPVPRDPVRKEALGDPG